MTAGETDDSYPGPDLSGALKANPHVHEQGAYVLPECGDIIVITTAYCGFRLSTTIDYVHRHPWR